MCQGRHSQTYCEIRTESSRTFAGKGWLSCFLPMSVFILLPLMKFNLKHLPAVLLLAGLSPLTAQAVVLPIIADTHIAAINAGGSVIVNINSQSKALLNFNTSTLPSGISSHDIAKATLVFYVKTVPIKGKLQVSAITGAWNENTVTLNKAPPTRSSQQTSTTISSGNTYFAVDVTTSVMDWVDFPTTTKGLMLEPAGLTPNTSLTIDSKEATLTSHPAYIEVVLKGLAGATGATGATGANSTVAGPTGPTGPASTVAGPTGSTGPASTVAGPTGPASTVAGPTGASAPVHAIGDSYGGGKVFYVYEGGQHGLIAATADQSTGIRWHGGTITNTMAKANGWRAGETNTVIIIANQGYANYAASICNEYSVTVAGVTYANWYLPSKDELNLF